MNIRLFDLGDDLRNLTLTLKYCNLKKEEDMYQFRNKTYGGGGGGGGACRKCFILRTVGNVLIFDTQNCSLNELSLGSQFLLLLKAL